MALLINTATTITLLLLLEAVVLHNIIMLIIKISVYCNEGIGVVAAAPVGTLYTWTST